MEVTKLIKRILAGTVCISLLSGFTGKEEYVELKGMLNGRSSSSFTREDRNILTTLTRGTRGEILETKKLRSGSFGIKIKVMNGKNAGKEMWVYHRDGDSDLALYETIPADWSTAKTTRDVATAQAVAAKRDKAAIEEDVNAKKAAKQKEAARSAIDAIESANKKAKVRPCVDCSAAPPTNEGRGNILRSEKRGMAPACYKIVNKQGVPTSKGQKLISIMSNGSNRSEYLASNALGAFCPKFNQLSSSDKMVAWAWFWTALGQEESGCKEGLVHPTRVKTRSGYRVINDRPGYGIWTMEKDRSLRIRTRGSECRDISTFEGQAKCSIEIMKDNQLSNGYTATSGPMYWGPIIRKNTQMMPHMKRLKLCF